MCLLNQELEPYRKYLLWGDPINVDAVRGMYATRIRFPFNFSHPQKYMKDAQDFLKIFANFDINDKVQNHNTSLLLVKAKKFLNLLADKLGERDWFLDHRSSEFDASIYAMLSILTDFPANNNEVKIHISQCPNLVRFMKRIRVKYYTDLGLVTTESNGIVTKVKHLVINKKTNSLSNGAIKFIAGFTAVTSMILFAISHGLLEIRTDDGEDEGYEYSNYIEDGDDGMGDDEWDEQWEKCVEKIYQNKSFCSLEKYFSFSFPVAKCKFILKIERKLSSRWLTQKTPEK